MLITQVLPVCVILKGSLRVKIASGALKWSLILSVKGPGHDGVFTTFDRLQLVFDAEGDSDSQSCCNRTHRTSHVIEFDIFVTGPIIPVIR